MELKTLLIVDDDPGMTRLLTRLLAAPGRSLVVAADGRQALEAAQAAAPDLIILDVQLPGLSGYDVCWALRADPRTRAVPVMMLSGLADVEHQLAGLGVGADTYAAKPFRTAELSERVDALLAAREARA